MLLQEKAAQALPVIRPHAGVREREALRRYHRRLEAQEHALDARGAGSKLRNPLLHALEALV